MVHQMIGIFIIGQQIKNQYHKNMIMKLWIYLNNIVKI